MRIALIVERFQPHGGVEAAAWAVAHRLAESGDEVHVFARQAACQDSDTTGAPRVHALHVPSGWQPLRVLAFSRAAARAAPRGDFDAVHSFSRTRHQDVYRAGGGCHAAYMERAYGSAGARLRRLSPRHATLLAMERAIFADPTQRVQCNSEMVRDELAERHRVAPERLTVLPNGVDSERFRPSGAPREEAPLRRELHEQAKRVWLLVGNGFRRKGLDTALAALGRSGGSRSALWVAGADDPAPWREQARRLGIADRVRFLGPRTDMERVYAAADALILPTRYDAFANVCLEAAAAGLPVVTSGANGAARWLGEAGLCVEDPEDVEGFAEALRSLGDAAVRDRLGSAARSRALDASWEAHLEALHALYREVKR